MTHYDFKDIPAQFVETIFIALGELPMKISGPVYSLLNQQRIEQDKEPNSPPKDHSDKVF
jgi:hypothetical protein